ncbi:DUF4306 domain-containing protein [Oceanobacillus sp. CFH 90083]|uniref:DUF4306 domain-containing protein n=1 Tax=Oceanobacillus sp. CFH 90083 TaxID=2592336 RepID=UPI00128DEF1B|nr:DUF4306 domain-containing protein [Oceanobacillus sp. CFH 90083]
MIIGLQIGLCLCVFVICAAFAWYEGSGIILHSDAWNTSMTMFNSLNGIITKASDLVVWDFFVYAAKYSPAYLIIMIVAGLYLLTLTGYLLFNKRNRFHLYLWGLSAILLIFSTLFIGVEAIDGRSFFSTFLLSGIACCIGGWIVKNKSAVQSLFVKTNIS